MDTKRRTALAVALVLAVSACAGMPIVGGYPRIIN